MRKTTIYFLLVLSIIFMVACEEEPPDPPVGQTSKLFFTLTQDSISYRMVKFNFDVENYELNTIDELGVCYGSEPDPTIEQSTSKIEPPSDTGNLQINELQPNTEYNARLYAILGDIDIYGDNKTFHTKQLGTPTVTTTEATDITENSATTGGIITDNGGSSIIARGVCWSTSTNPTLDDNFTNDGTGMGSYTSQITGLAQGNTYYARAYSKNDAGTAYGNQISFEATSFPDEGLVAYYKFDGDASDATGNENDGTVNGATIADGKIGQAYDFDGSDDYVSIGEIPTDINISTHYTISLWFNSSLLIDINSTLGGDGDGLIYRETSGSNNFGIWFEPASWTYPGALCFEVGQSNRNLVSSTNSWTNDIWYHVVISVNSGTGTLYINGLIEDSAAGINPISFSETPIDIGTRYRDDNSRFFNGLIDEIGIWNRSLTEDEIDQLYNSGNGLQYSGN